MILSFLVSNFLSYSGNLNRGRKKRYAKVWYSHYCSTSCYKKMYCSDWMHCILIGMLHDGVNEYTHTKKIGPAIQTFILQVKLVSYLLIVGVLHFLRSFTRVLV